jgi:Ca2+-binding RTX toxin-like protein
MPPPQRPSEPVSVRFAVVVVAAAVFYALILVRTGSAASYCSNAGTRFGDTLIGTEHVDVLCGLAGADLMRGVGGRDTLIGGRGIDDLNGGHGRDLIQGMGGGDVLLGGRGHDRLRGGRDGDSIHSVDDSRDIVNAGPGDDYCILDNKDVVVNCEHPMQV